MGAFVSTLLRRTLEYASRGRILRRRLPDRYGGCELYVSPECGLQYWRRNVAAVDPQLLCVASETLGAGAVVWDIGANVGLFSFAAAGLVGSSGKVYAIEPDTFLVQILRRSAAIQNSRSARVEVIPCAVSDSVDIHPFNIAARARASNFLEGLGNSMTGGIRETHLVLTVSINWLATRIPAPDVIKIDAEGAELSILKGARELLAAKRPRIICEVGKENERAVATLLTDLGYLLYDGALPKEERRPSVSAPWTTLAVPRVATGKLCDAGRNCISKN